jgi:hypothetical protein
MAHYFFILIKNLVSSAGGQLVLTAGEFHENGSYCSKESAVFCLTTEAESNPIYERFSHRAHTERQLPLFGVHSITMEKLAQPDLRWGVHAHYIYYQEQNCGVRSS